MLLHTQHTHTLCHSDTAYRAHIHSSNATAHRALDIVGYLLAWCCNKKEIGSLTMNVISHASALELIPHRQAPHACNKLSGLMTDMDELDDPKALDLKQYQHWFQAHFNVESLTSGMASSESESSSDTVSESVSESDGEHELRGDDTTPLMFNMIASVDWILCLTNSLPIILMNLLQIWALTDTTLHPVTTENGSV